MVSGTFEEYELAYQSVVRKPSGIVHCDAMGGIGFLAVADDEIVVLQATFGRCVSARVHFARYENTNRGRIFGKLAAAGRDACKDSEQE